MSTTTLTADTGSAKPFNSTFILNIGLRQRASVAPAPSEGDALVKLATVTGSLVMTTAEALSLSAALSAVAVHILEEPREIRRHTEPGNPSFEEAI